MKSTKNQILDIYKSYLHCNTKGCLIVLHEYDLTIPKLQKDLVLKRPRNKNLLRDSCGLLEKSRGWPLTLSIVCPISFLIESIILGSTGYPEASRTQNVFMAFPDLVATSALVTVRLFSRKIRVTSDSSPTLSVVHSSSFNPYIKNKIKKIKFPMFFKANYV